MEKTYKNYKNLNLRIGAALLIFLLLFNISQVILVYAGFISGLFSDFINPEISNVFVELLWGGLYLASFMLPVLFFYLISRKKVTCSMHLEFKLSKYLPLFILAGLGINFIFSYVNYIFVYPIFGDSMSEITTTTTGEYLPYHFILSMITTAMVPAFCEEFLFRGMILSNLLPYGKKTAIIISAVMFGFMHQNPAQIIYTTVAGIFLGIVFIESGSIWGGIIFHFINNLISVISEMISNVFPEKLSEYYNSLLIIGIMLVGMIMLFALIIIYLKKRKKITLYTENQLGGGIFEKEFVLYEDTNEYRLSTKKKISGFFSPTNIIFITLSVLTMLLLCLMIQFI